MCTSESPSAGGPRFLCVSPRAPRRGGGVPQNAPSKGVLDRSTPLNGGHIYRYGHNTPSRFGRIGRESEQIAPPAFLVTRPRCEHRLGKNNFPHSCLHLESILELSIFSENLDSKMKRMNLDVSKFVCVCVCVNTPIGTGKCSNIELFPP